MSLTLQMAVSIRNNSVASFCEECVYGGCSVLISMPVILIFEQTALLLIAVCQLHVFDEHVPSLCEMHSPTQPRYDMLKSLYHKLPEMLYGIVEHSCLSQSEF